MLKGWLNAVLLSLSLVVAMPLLAQPVCSDLFADPSGINPNLGANGISPFDLANVPWQNTPWPASGTVLAGGNYYFGSLDVGNNYQLSVAAGQKAVIYVNDTFDVRNFLRLNANGDTEQLTLVVRANVAVNNLVEINALVFSAGSISINAQNVIIGGLAANGAISVGNSTVVRDDDAINALQLPGLCTAAGLPSARAHYPLDFCPAQNNSIVADLTGNYPATAINAGAVTDGQVLEAADFSAAGGDYINVPAAALNGLTNFTVSMWFRLDAHNDFKQLFSASNNQTSTELEFYINAANEVRAGVKGQYVNFGGGSASPVVANNSWTQATLTRSNDQLCLYLNQQRISCQTVSNASLSVNRAAVGIWWQRNGAFDDDFRGDIDEVLLFQQALTPAQVSAMYQNQLAGNSFDGTARLSSCAQCLTDSFSSSLSDSWVTARSSGNFTPTVVNNRLRMTQAVANQSTSATYQRLYPAADNLVVVEFDYWAYGGNGADGLALVLSDAEISPQPGAFGGPLGYGFKPGIPGFAGGWLGFGIDEYGNYSNEGGSTNVGRRRQSVVVRGSGEGTAGYRYLRGTCNNGATNINTNCLSPAVDGNQNTPHRYRFIIDSTQAGTTLVSVQRDTKSGQGFENLILPFNVQEQTGQAPVPENFFLSITGSTGGSTNIHELDNLSICALRSEPVGVLIDHFQLSHPAEMVSCLAAAVEVKACVNQDCSDTYTDPVAVTLSADANASWVGGNTITLNNGSGIAYLRNPAIGANPQVSIDAISSVPAAKAFFPERNRCLTEPGGTPCEIRFVDSGLLFAEVDGQAPVNHQTAGETFNGVLRAVRSNTTTGACDARVRGPKEVELGFSCENPGTCISGQQFSVDETPIAANDAGTVNNRTTLMLNFDDTGSAPLAMNYSDVGQLRLHARLALAEQLPDPAITLQTSSNAFVVRPHTLAVVQATRPDGTANPGTTNSGDGFIAAGEPFNVVIEAQNAAGAATPNFGRENPRQQVELAFSALAYPDTGSNGVLNAGATDLTQPAANGRQQVSNVRWNEVGSINLQARLNNDSYLATSDVAVKPDSADIGRFYPHHFELVSSEVTNSCNNIFSYMSQPALTINYQLAAKGAAGNTLFNYHSTDYSGTAVATVVAEQDAVRLPADRFSVVAANWQRGVYNVEQDNASFNRAAQRDGPYAALQPGIKLLLEQDGRDFQSYTLGADAAALDGRLNMRFGRLALDNTYGPEHESLPVRLQAQYWHSPTQRFIDNSEDNCTVLSAGTVVQPGSSNINLQLQKEQPYVGAATLTLQASSNPQAAFTAMQQGSSVIDGLPALLLPATGERGRGEMEYLAPIWLQGDWDSDGVFDDNPQAEFMFGRFRGNPRQISWRELFQ